MGAWCGKQGRAYHAEDNSKDVTGDRNNEHESQSVLPCHHNGYVLATTTLNKPGLLLSVGEQGHARVWNWDEDRSMAAFRVPGQEDGRFPRINCVHWSCNSSGAFFGQGDGTVTFRRVLDPEAGGDSRRSTDAVFLGHQMSVTAVAQPTDSSRVLWTGSRDGDLRVWDVATQQETAYRHISRNIVTGLEPVPGSQHEAIQISEDLTIRVWDTRSLQVVQHFGPVQWIHIGVAAHASQPIFATASKGFDGSGCMVSVWDRRRSSDGDMLAALPVCEMLGHTQTVNTVAWVPWSDQRLVSASNDGTVRLWDTASAEETAKLTAEAAWRGGGFVSGVCASGSSRHAVYATTLFGGVVALDQHLRVVSRALDTDA